MFFIKLFKTFNRYYFYDVNSNSINEISEELYNLLKENDLTAQNFDNCNDLQNLLKSQRISSNKPLEYFHPFSVILDDFVDRKLSFMSLQVTQNCNLRCKYCPYTYNEGFNRLHNHKRMTKKTIALAIDMLVNKSIDNELLTIGFYGGEPLLEYELIKYTVEKIKKRIGERKIRFTITTNGTLLNEEILEFLDKYKFSVLISLDGPKDINDKNRIFHMKDSSVFDVVMNNISLIKDNYPNIMKRIGISMVVDPTNNIMIYKQLFDKYDYLNYVIANISLLDESHYINKRERSDEFRRVIGNESFLTYLEVLNEIETSKNTFFNKLIRPNIVRKLEDLIISNEIPTNYAPSGQCIPGNRLFVSANGDIFPCEKINELSDFTVMGNVQDGIITNKAKKIMNCSEIKFNECRNCFALRHCTNCIKNFSEVLDKNENFNIDNHCNLIREKVLSEIITRTHLSEAKNKQVKILSSRSL